MRHFRLTNNSHQSWRRYTQNWTKFMALCRGCCVQLLIPSYPTHFQPFSFGAPLPPTIQKKKKGGGEYVQSKESSSVSDGLSDSGTTSSDDMEASAKKQDKSAKKKKEHSIKKSSKKKKQLATEACTDFCPSSFVLVHVCMFILKN